MNNEANISACEHFRAALLKFFFPRHEINEWHLFSAVTECSVLSASSTYTVDMSCGRAYGDQAEYRCRAGYTLTNGNDTVICQSDSALGPAIPPHVLLLAVDPHPVSPAVMLKV